MSLLQKKLSTVMAVGEDRLTVVQGSSTKIDFCSTAKIDWTNESKAAESLLTLVPSAQRRQSHGLCLVMPRIMFFTNVISLPSVDDFEIRKMLALQISSHLPYAEEQAVWDFVVCSRRGLTSDVLLMAIQRETVMKYLRVLSAAGFFPTVVTISSCALAALLATVEPAAHTVLFFPDENSTEICFCAEEKFYFSRAIAYGLKDMAGDKRTDFFAQVRLTFASQRKGFSQYSAPAGLYLTRNANDIPLDFLENLAKESGISWKEFSLDTFKQKIGTFSFSNPIPVDAIALLPILRQDFKTVSNFLPKDYKDRHNVKAQRKNTVALIFLVLGSILSLLMAVSAPAVKKAQQLKSLDEKLKKIENPVSKLRKEHELLAALQGGLNARISPLAVIEELYRSAPPGLSFSRIRISEQNELNLEGQALQSSAVNDLQEKMIAANVFHDVRLEHAVRRTSPLGEVVQFLITAKLQKTSP